MKLAEVFVKTLRQAMPDFYRGETKFSLIERESCDEGECGMPRLLPPDSRLTSVAASFIKK